MGTVDMFGPYVRSRLDEWGQVFSLRRDMDYLGYHAKNMLQVLIEHRGEMPPRNIGFKPLEISPTAHQIELIVTDIAREQVSLACCMRAYYCGNGRRTVERFETANLLIASCGAKTINRQRYLAMCDVGFAQVRGYLIGIAQNAA